MTFDDIVGAPRSPGRPLLIGTLATAVAVAFADSSIVVLALPELYASFDTTIDGVAWVITSYNLAMAIGALALLVVRRSGGRALLGVGSALFLVASTACGLADSLSVLIVWRSVQGLGGALLLVGSLPLLGTLAGSDARGVATWTTAGTFGAAVGPALGGLLTQAFDWRAIFIAQAPVAGLALLSAIGTRGETKDDEGWWKDIAQRTMPFHVGLALIAGALVGALFLGVLLVVDVFRYSPLEGALIVSAIPAGVVLSRPLVDHLPAALSICGGAALLAAGLLGLALLPSSELGYTLTSFGLAGFGLGLTVPGLTHAVLRGEGGIVRRATLSVGLRHLGLVLALAIVASLLAEDLARAVAVARLNGTAVIVDGRLPVTTKIPLALDIRDALERAPEGEIPDLTAPFEENGAATEPGVRVVQNSLVATIEEAITRGFRRSFVFCAMLAALAIVPIVVWRRRLEP